MDINQALNQAWDELTGAGSQFAVENQEVNGQSIRCFANAPPDLRTIWMATEVFGDQDYLVFNNERLSYHVAHAQVASIANWLQSQGVGAGDRVAISMRNYPEWLLCYWAIVSVGAAVVGMNAWWVANEMAYALKDSTPRVLIVDHERYGVFLPIREQFQEITVVPVRARGEMPQWTTPWIDLVSQSDTLPDVRIDPDSDACIFYTSGTTGRPKGAQLTHRGCVANLFNILFFGTLGLHIQELLGVPAPSPNEGPPLATLAVTPLFHVTANNCVAHPTTIQGGKIVTMYRWDPEIALEIIEQEKITTLSGVPVMARELLAHPDFAKTDTSSLRLLGGGGAVLQPDLVEKINQVAESVLPNTGYGMTETCGIITSLSGPLFVANPESCGRAVPTLEAKVVDDQGNSLPDGEVGEFWVRGAPVIAGYLNDPQATAENITDGWLHTGDIGYINKDAFIFIVDRKKDMILRGGENIYCAEVDNVVFSHPDVAECSSFGVTDDRLGEEVGVAIYLKENASADGNAIREHCKELMAAFKIPRYIWFQDEALPRNANGKFLKRELQDRLKVEDAA